MLLSAFYSDKYGNPVVEGLAVCPWDDFCKQISPCKNWWLCSTKCPLAVQSWLLLRCSVAVATLLYGGRHVIVWRSPRYRMAVATFVCHPSRAIRNGLSLSVKASRCIALKTNFKNADFCGALSLKESKVFPFVEKMLCWYIFIFLIFNIQFFYVTFAPINLEEGCGNHKIQWLTMLIPPLIDCPAHRAVEACSSC